MKQFKLILILYALVSAFLLLYSYTQVDLNLTLSRMSLWQTMQKSFQYIGYYQRPLSTGIFLVILASLFVLYFWLLKLVKHKLITGRQLWLVIGVNVVILLWSYPAFSYDFFNYMFTAKTVLIYHKNPYVVIPLQFSGVDPWPNFMRWTHLPSAYTPLWILLTLPPYLLGFGLFLLILWNLKLLIAGFYLLTIWGIGEVLKKVDVKHQTLGMAIFAFNPLIIIESLVSAHNDIVMMAVGVSAMLLYLRHKPWSSFLLLALSIALKLMTIFLLPVVLWRWDRSRALVLMVIGLVLVLLQREVLPWYFVWIMPFVALLPQRWEVTLAAGGVSLGLLLRYAPFLYLGHWDNPVPLIKTWVTLAPSVVALLLIIAKKLLDRKSLS